jgi:hypothetical protein
MEKNFIRNESEPVAAFRGNQWAVTLISSLKLNEKKLARGSSSGKLNRGEGKLKNKSGVSIES